MKKIIYLIILYVTFSVPSIAIELTPQEKEFLKNNPVVTIASEPENTPFAFLKNSERVGLEVDLLNILSEKTGLQFERRFDIWNKNISRFKKKQVDIITTVSFTPEREKFTLFTTPYFKVPNVIFVRDDFGNFEGMKSLEGKKVGVIKGIYYTKQLRAYPALKVITFNDYEGLIDALVYGKIDALVQNLPVMNALIKKNFYTNVVVAGELNLPDIQREDFRFGITPDKPLLHSILQKAMDDIDTIRWEALKDKWLDVKLLRAEKDFSALFTQAEKEYLKKVTVKVGMLKGYYPFSYLENGKLAGYSYDYFSLVASAIGLKFEIQVGDWAPNLTRFKEKKLDIIDAISHTKRREAFTRFSEPYFEIPNVIFAPKDKFKNYKGLASLKGKRVGVNKGIYYFDTIKALNLFELVPFISSREKIKALAFGKIDAAFNKLTSGQRYILQGAYSNLEVLGEIDSQIVKKEDLRFGVQKNNPLLYSILKKGMTLVSESNKLALNNKYFGVGSTGEQTQLLVPLTKEEKSFLKKTPVIRVHNDSSWPPYNYYKNGRPQGFSIDMMNLVARKVGLKVKYVTGSTWKEFLGQIKEGHLDVLLNIVQTADRKKYLRFTPPYADNPNSILSKKKRPYATLNALSGKTVSVPFGFFTEEMLRKSYPKIKIHLTKDILEAIKAVSSGTSEAALGQLATMNYFLTKHLLKDLVISGEATPGTPQYSLLRMATRKDQPVLTSILTKGLESISVEEKRKLQKKWFFNKRDTALHLTQAEQAYLASKKVIKMSVLPNTMPFEAIDENGKHQGITADVIQLISEKIKTPIVLVPTKSWKESLENIKTRKCDILPLTTNIQNRHKYMNFTAPYFEEPLVVATADDKFFIKNTNWLKNRKVGIVKGYSSIKQMIQVTPGINFVTVESTKDGLEKVQRGELFGHIDPLSIIAYTIQKEGMVDLKVAGKLEHNVRAGIASRNDEPLLNSILSKALKSIKRGELRSITGKWITIKMEQSFDYRKLIYISLFFGIVLLTLTYKNRLFKKLNQRLLISEDSLQKKLKENQQLIHVLSHDLKNPVGSALSLSQIIQESPKESEELIQYIALSLKQSIAIIDMVRDYMVIDEHKKKLTLASFNLKHLVETALKILENKLNEKEISIEMEIDPGIRVKVDEVSFINSVVSNILTNAIKFSYQGSSIQVGAITKSSTIQLFVRDQGVGMSKDLVGRLFKINEFTSRLGTQQEVGTGFGMPLVKKFIEEYGGSIEVYSQEEKDGDAQHGTEVRIILPEIS